MRTRVELPPSLAAEIMVAATTVAAAQQKVLGRLGSVAQEAGFYSALRRRG
jgi:hypothetical protein